MNRKKLQHFIELFNAERFDEMEAQLRKFLQKNKRDGVAWKALGACLKRAGKPCFDEMKMATELIPHDYEVWFNLGVEQHAQQKHQDAIKSYEVARRIRPDEAKIYNNLGNALKAVHLNTEAQECYSRAIDLDPMMSEAYMNMGTEFLGSGKYARACDYFEKTLEINPNFIEAYNNIIFALDLMTTENTESQQNARKMFNEVFMQGKTPVENHANDLTVGRKLRIGYVSGDFREHSAARVFGAMIEKYDHDRFEVFCYDNKIRSADTYTARMMPHAEWRHISNMSAEAAAAKIMEDQIDILVDLSGHSAQNRLDVFSLKPAPIQITAWGYATGTGLETMDYFFADPIVVPEDERHLFSEQVVDLPCVASSYFTEPFPDIAGLPYETNGYITFGCFNRLHKVTDECYAVWAEILNKVPNSRMILKAGELDNEEARKNAMWQFIRAGISQDRIVMMGSSNWLQHVTAYNLVDIALDPFPHGGGVTAMEGMIMGVPAVVLKWPTVVGRLSASLMHAVDMDSWVAENANEYIQMAVDKSGKIDELLDDRNSLRQRFDESFLGDHAKYVGSVEEIYRQLWNKYILKKTAQSS